MKIMQRPRRSGKTTIMVQLLRDTPDAMLVCVNTHERDRLRALHPDLADRIIDTIDLGRKTWRGQRRPIRRLLFDNLDVILAQHFGLYPAAATVSPDDDSTEQRPTWEVPIRKKDDALTEDEMIALLNFAARAGKSLRDFQGMDNALLRGLIAAGTARQQPGTLIPHHVPDRGEYATTPPPREQCEAIYRDPTSPEEIQAHCAREFGHSNTHQGWIGDRVDDPFAQVIWDDGWL